MVSCACLCIRTSPDDLAVSKGLSNKYSDYVVCLQGLIRSDGSGLATFSVSYACLCMRLWPEEVVDAEVEQVTSYGIRCKVGPFRIFVSERVRISRTCHV